MIDLKFLRENPDTVRASQRTRGEDPGLVDALLDADASRRAAVLAGDNARAEQKALGKKVGKASPEERPALLDGAKELAAKVKELEAEQNAAQEALERAHMALSNVVQEGAPAGGEDDFVTLETVGDLPTFDFEPKDHLTLGESLGLIDMERGAKVSGARFYFLTGYGALLQLGLLQLAAQKATANGFTMMIPPVLVRPEIMRGTGFLGQHADEVYHLEDDDLYLVGTSEVPLAGYHSGEILDLSGGPKRYAAGRRASAARPAATARTPAASSACTSSTRSRCSSTASPRTRLRSISGCWCGNARCSPRSTCYRVIDVAGGDLGSSAARKFDCEAWVPTQERYRELTSTSNCTTFQARRLGVRYRDENGKPQTAATLNGTLATTRWLVALLENHQQADGTVKVPPALVPFVGREVLEPVG